MLDFISVIDISCSVGADPCRKVSLAISNKHPESLTLLGVLSHNSDITLDRENAQKLIKWLETIK